MNFLYNLCTTILSKMETKQRTSLFDVICLVKYTRDKGPIIIEKNPSTFELNQQEVIITSCSFPENSKQPTAIFTFSNDFSLCYSYSFIYENENYSVTICSHFLISDCYLKLLETVKEKMENQTPLEKFHEVSDLLLKWKVKQNKFFAYYAGSEEIGQVNFNAKANFDSFHPNEWIDKKTDMLNLWKNLICGKNILVFGESPSIVSNCVLSILSLLAPMKYTDKFLPFTRFGDPRFAELINGSKKWKVVGTTNDLVLSRCEQFNLIIKLNGNKKPYGSSKSKEDEIRKKESSLLGKLVKLIDYKIRKDPYFDLLMKPISKDDIIKCGIKCKGTELSFDDIYNFIQLDSFTNWRKNIVFRSSLRESFLSISPETVINETDPKILKTMLTHLNNLKNTYKDDVHYFAVLSKHAKIIMNKLGENEK